MCRPSWSLYFGFRTCVRRESSAIRHISFHQRLPTPPIPSSRTTKYVVVVPTLKAVPISIQYLVPSNIRVGPSDANTFRGHRLTTQKGYTYAAYKMKFCFENKSWIVRDGSRFSDCAPDENFQGNVLTPPTPKKNNHVKNGLTAIKCFGK